MDKIIGER